MELQQRFIQDLIDNEPLRQRMGAASRCRALERYSWQVVARQHVQLWAHLIEVAAADRGVPDPPEYLRPNYPYCFAHYATHVLDATTAVELTSEGQLLQPDTIGRCLHPLLRGYIDPTMAVSLANLLRGDAIEATGASTVEALRRRFAGGRHDATETDRHIMWMAKYGFVRLVGMDKSARHIDTGGHRGHGLHG